LKKLTLGGSQRIPLASPHEQPHRAAGATIPAVPSNATVGYAPAHAGATGGGGPPLPS
jgi:hypothetical protein